MDPALSSFIYVGQTQRPTQRSQGRDAGPSQPGLPERRFLHPERIRDCWSDNWVRTKAEASANFSCASATRLLPPRSRRYT